MADLFKFVQAQSFALAGGGAVAGATSITLKSFAGIDGALLTMTDFGSIGFMTLEPGNGALEEQISFTGVTQNSNGTATLTGVSTVGFISPYTATSGTAKTHAGSTTAIVSNTSGFYDKLTSKSDDETITGLWDFPSGANNPTIGAGVYVAPTLDTQIATKKYVDNTATSGAPDANTTTKGVVQIATQAQVDAKTATGSTGASIVPTPALARSTLLSDYVADTGVADAYAIAPSPTISAYVDGQRFSFKVKTTNTTTSTLAVNALSATAIFKNDGATALIAGDIVAGEIVEVEKKPNGFMLMTNALTGNLPAQAGSAGKFLTTDAITPSWGYPYDYQAFTGSGTWTKPSNLVGTEMVIVQAWGGGGGGGGTTGNGAAGPGGAGGGGGGAFVTRQFRASDLGGTVTVTIGAGGAGGAAGVNDGVAGGTTTFGSFVSAFGGGLGAKSTGGTATNGGGGGGGGNGTVGGDASTTTFGAGGGFGGGATSANATNNDSGGGAGATASNANGGTSANGGGGGGSGGASGGVGGSSFNGGGGGGAGGSAAAGGTSIYGGAGGAGSVNAAGTDGSAPSGGGGGAGYFNNAASRAGGAGARGEVRVWVIK